MSGNVSPERFVRAKRLFDLALTVPGLLVLSPALGAVALCVRWKLGSPVLFTQERAGLHGRPFRIVKFRTMTAARDASGALLPDEQRLTPLGRFLRSTSLDELPELLNVLRGEMSLVGPRPLPTQYLPRYSPEQRRRHEVLPGITGLAMVRGRNALTWEEKFRYDLEYVDRRSFWLDLRIVLETIVVVLSRRGISHPGRETMPEFLGSGEGGGA